MIKFRLLKLPLFIGVTFIQLCLGILSCYDGGFLYQIGILIHLGFYVFSILPFWMGSHLLKSTDQISHLWGWLLIAVFVIINLITALFQLEGLKGTGEWHFG